MNTGEISTIFATGDPEARRMATVALGTAQGPDVVPLLMKALADSNWRVREEAVRVGSHLIDEAQLFPALLSGLCQGHNVGLRNAAIALFGAVGEPAYAVLSEALNEVELENRKFVIEAIAAAGGARAARVLVECLESTDANVVAATIDALALVGGPEAEAALRKILAWPDTFQRMAALSALNHMEATVPWSVLAPLYEDRLVSRVAVPALGRCREVAAVEPLMRTLNDPVDRMLADAVASLQRLSRDVPEAIPRIEEQVREVGGRKRDRLVRLAQADDLTVRKGAVLLLSLMHDRGAVDGMLQLVRDGVMDESLCRVAERWGAELIELLLSLQSRHGGSDRGAALMLASEIVARQMRAGVYAPGGPLPSRLLSELRRSLYGHDLELRLSAAKAIGPFAERADAVPLVEAATGADWDLSDACGPVLIALSEREPEAVRDALAQVELAACDQDLIAELVAKLDGSRAFSRLHGALLADDAGVRCAALAGLSELASAESAELIALSLRDSSLVVQLRAVAALGSVRGASGEALGVHHLLPILKTGSPELRAGAARALGETGASEAMAALKELLTEGDALIQVAAIQALRKVAAPDIEDALLQALRHSDAEVVKQALEALLELARDRARGSVEQALRHPRWDVRQLAVQLLGRYSDRAAAITLSEALASEQDDMVRAEIEGALRAVRKAL